MNVAAHALVLATQPRPAESRRESKTATRPAAALQPLRDAQAIASGRPVASDSERREPFAERRTPRRTPSEAPRSFPRRDGDERGRLLDVYC